MESKGKESMSEVRERDKTAGKASGRGTVVRSVGLSWRDRWWLEGVCFELRPRRGAAAPVDHLNGWPGQGR